MITFVNPETPPRIICYMPQLLPDELIYSLLARLVAYNALTNPRRYLESLFGTKDIIPAVDLPTSLESLHFRFGAFSPCNSIDEIIDTGTLYPYHRPFLTQDRDKIVREILLHGGAKGLKTLMGRVANRFGANPPLQYCAQCLQDDFARFGTSYWRRMHHLPGVTCCATHGIELTPYLWPSTLSDRQRLRMIPWPHPRYDHQTKADPRQFWFSKLSRDLLDARLPALDLSARQCAYKSAIAALGFCSSRSRIDYKGLEAALCSHYDNFDGFLHRDRLLSTCRHPLAWLHTVFERPARASHPICHLILIGFLFGTIEEFQEAMRHPSSLESIHHVDIARMDTSVVTKGIREQHDCLLRDSRVSCRKVAQVLDLSVTTVVRWRRALGVVIAERRKYLSPSKLRKIARAFARGQLPSLIAAKYQVSLATVYRAQAQSPHLLSARAQLLHNRERLKQRTRWKQVIKNHSDAGTTEIRALAPAVYAWLYRHDRDWLQEACKTLQLIRSHVSRVDWAARDIELCRRLAPLANDLRLTPNRPRLSKSLLLRLIGESMLRANLGRLPRLNALLSTLVESTESFQIFRIERTINQLATWALPLSESRIQRLAGIRQWTPPLAIHAQRLISEVTTGVHFKTICQMYPNEHPRDAS